MPTLLNSSSMRPKSARQAATIAVEGEWSLNRRCTDGSLVEATVITVRATSWTELSSQEQACQTPCGRVFKGPSPPG